MTTRPAWLWTRARGIAERSTPGVLILCAVLTAVAVIALVGWWS